MDALSPVSMPLDMLRTASIDEPARQRKALQELEGVFLNLLLKEMRKSVPEGDLLGATPAQKMFTEMLDEVFAQKMAESGQLGIADLMAEQIAVRTRQREVREAVFEAGQELVPLPGRGGPPDLLDLPQPRAGAGFLPVKSFGPAADRFSVDGLR